MEWTKEDLKALREYRKIIDSDDIRVKEIIKKKLLDNKSIIHVLNNKELEDADAEADDYFGVNILPYYMVSPTQHDVENFICYEVKYNELNRFNKYVKYLQIIFHILCEQKNIIDKDTYLARHDLLGALIIDEFNWTNYFGRQIHLVEDIPSTVDNSYASRTLIFEQTTDNNIVKTKNLVPQTANKDVVY